MSERKTFAKATQSNLIAGVLTIIPLIVVWFVLDFIFTFLSAVGSPVESGIAMFIADRMPQAEPLLDNHVFRWLVAVTLSLLLIYIVGNIASRMAGKRLIAAFEGLLARIPVVETVYSASKKLVSVLQQSPGGGARVVLIDFPHPGMKAIGLVMRNFRDSSTGQELAAVFVPTTPNPTSGYLAILPVQRLVPTAMTMDQAMTMIVSGGTVAPDNFTMTAAPPGTGLAATSMPELVETLR
jgi:uncharacterized membrane protein